MAEDIVARVEQMERSHHELREILIRDREEHWEQMAQIMEIIMKMSRGKRIADDTGLVNTTVRTLRVTEGLAYNPYHLAGHPISMQILIIVQSHQR